VDPEHRGMKAIIHRGLQVAVILPIACAVMGWSLGRFSMRPRWNQSVLPRETPETTGSLPRMSGSPWRRSGSGSYRDPFQSVGAGVLEGSSDSWKGFDTLRLSAIWMDPNDPVAVIDGRVVRPGDGVGGFRVAHCVRDGVWITGPVGSRRLCLQAKPQLKTGTPRS
jgi:hypothetical protein